MQAELCSHVGLNGNFFCRCCDAGGTKEYKSSNEGFSKLMVVRFCYVLLTEVLRSCNLTRSLENFATVPRLVVK